MRRLKKTADRRRSTQRTRPLGDEFETGKESPVLDHWPKHRHNRLYTVYAFRTWQLCEGIRIKVNEVDKRRQTRGAFIPSQEPSGVQLAFLHYHSVRLSTLFVAYLLSISRLSLLFPNLIRPPDIRPYLCRPPY